MGSSRRPSDVTRQSSRLRRLSRAARREHRTMHGHRFHRSAQLDGRHEPSSSNAKTGRHPRAADGAFVEPRGCNRRQSLANRLPLETAKQAKSAATGCLRRSMVRRGSRPRRLQSVVPQARWWRRRHPCAHRSRAGASTGAPRTNYLQINIFGVVSKIARRRLVPRGFESLPLR
jgi:hypothetical protein